MLFDKANKMLSGRQVRETCFYYCVCLYAGKLSIIWCPLPGGGGHLYTHEFLKAPGSLTFIPDYA